MPRRQSDQRQRENVNLRTIVIAGLVVIAGILLLALAEVISTAWAKSVVDQLGGLLVATGALAVAWDLLGRRAFAREVLAQAGLGVDVEQAGLRRVTDQYLKEVEWEELFRGATRIDVFVAYGNSWRNMNRQELTTFLQDPGHRLKIYHADTRSEMTMKVLAERFDMTVAELTAKIGESVREFTAMANAAKARVEIYTYPGDYTFSFYRFDGTGVLALYSHTKTRTNVPTVVFTGGSLFRFLYGELKSIREHSTRVY